MQLLMLKGIPTCSFLKSKDGMTVPTRRRINIFAILPSSDSAINLAIRFDLYTTFISSCIFFFRVVLFSTNLSVHVHVLPRPRRKNANVSVDVCLYLYMVFAI